MLLLLTGRTICDNIWPRSGNPDHSEHVRGRHLWIQTSRVHGILPHDLRNLHPIGYHFLQRKNQRICKNIYSQKHFRFVSVSPTNTLTKNVTAL